eukprot:scaffold932_cov207-Alexandrium_tamarense.AAC.18
MSSSATGDVIALIQKRLLGGEATARGSNGVGACSKEEPSAEASVATWRCVWRRVSTLMAAGGGGGEIPSHLFPEFAS